MSFHSVIDVIQDGTDHVRAADINRPLNQLQDNCLYLQALVAAQTGTQAGSGSGTSTDGAVSLFTRTSTGNVLGVFSFKNTDGAHSILLSFNLTDAYGTNAIVTQTVAAGADYVLDLAAVQGSLVPPYSSVTVLAQSSNAGQAATYSWRASTVG